LSFSCFFEFGSLCSATPLDRSLAMPFGLVNYRRNRARPKYRQSRGICMHPGFAVMVFPIRFLPWWGRK
jgi:hypothetical protein